MAQMERKEKIRLLRLVLAEIQITLILNQGSKDYEYLKVSEHEYVRLLKRLDKECPYRQL
jgi:hypothetical protein